MRIRRPSPATVISIVALVVALGGTSYAALKLPKNSVGTAQLKANAVTGGKVKDGSLSLKDIGGALPGGAKGEKGDKGDAGSPGTNGTGTPGTNGAAGATVKAKMTSAGPADSSTTNPNPIPLTNNTFTQGAGNPEQLDIKFDWQPPGAGCGNPNGGAVTIKDNGTTIFSSQSFGGGSSQQIRATQHVFAPASATPHNFTAEVADNCPGAESATVGQIMIDVTEFSAP
jgi:hypothetical protein